MSVLALLCGFSAAGTYDAQAACFAAGGTITCNGAANPLAPSYANGGNNLTVNINAGAGVGVLLGVGGTAMTFSGNNVSLNNAGTIDPMLLGQGSILSSGLVIGNANASTVTVNNSGVLRGTSGLLGANLPGLTGMALALQNGTGGVSTVTNTGTIAVSPLAGLSVATGDMPAVAIYGGGQVNFTNSSTGIINGRVAFQAPGTPGVGNSFINAGTITGSVSLGAGTTNTFTARTGSSVTAGLGTSGNTLGVTGLSLSFAAAGVVDGGAGGNNTLQLNQAVGGPASGALSLANYINFNTLDVQSGDWTLSGISTASSVTLGGGSVTIDNAGAFGSSTIQASGTGIGSSVAGLDLTNAIVIGSGGLTVQGAQDFTLSGVLSGTGGLTKTGIGTVTLAGANTYTGSTTIDAGTLALAAGGSIAGTGALNLSGVGAVLDISASGANQTIGALSGVAGSAVSLGVNALTIDSAANATFAGTIGGTGGLVKQGSGTQVLSGANTYTGGTTIDAGTLALGAGGSLAAAGSVNVAAGATLDISGSGTNQTIGALIGGNGSSVALGVHTLTFGDATNQSFGGSIGGTGSLTKAGSGTQTLTGANTYTGGTTVSGGALALGAGGSLAATGAVTLSSGAFDISASGANQTIGALSGAAGTAVTLGANTLTFGDATNQSFDGVISGTGGLVKQGAGSQVLTGAQAYGGSTTINGGLLRVEGSLASAAVTVAAGGTLGGSGSIAGAVTVADGGILAPGSSPGTLTVGSLVLNNQSRLGYELGTPGVVGGNLNDLVVVNGALTLDGVLDITPQAGFGAGSYRLFNYAGALTDGGLLFGIVPAGYEFSVDTTHAGEINLLASVATLQFWNGARTTADGSVHGGSGTWDAASTNWTGSSGNVASAWSNLTAVFAGPAGGSVTLAGNQQVAGLQFATDGYVLNGPGALQVAGATELRIDPGLTATINAVIEGTGGLTKTGAGTIVLAGSNTYAGGTTINAGTLQVASNANLGDAAGGLTFNGGTLATTADFAMFRSVTLAGTGSVDVAAGTQFELGGAVAGIGGLTKRGAGTLVLSGVNTSSGGTTVSAGVLQAGSADALGSGALVLDGGTFRAGTSFINSFANAIKVNASGGAVDVNGQVMTLSGGISDGNGAGGALAFVNSDSHIGAVELGGANSYSGPTSIGAGVKLTALTDAAFSPNSDVTLAATGALMVNGHSTTVRSLAGSGLVVNGHDTQLGTLTVALPSGAATFAGTLSDGEPGDAALTLVKAGAGTQILSGRNSYTGGTTISGGTLQLGDGGTSGSILGDVANNGTLAFNRSGAIVFSGAITGSGALRQDGTGTVVLTGTNSYAGGTTIAAGTLQIGNRGTTGSITGDVVNNGTLAFKRADNVSFSGAISGSGAVEQLGPGTVTLTGTNTYTGGTTITASLFSLADDAANSGTLAFNGSEALSFTSSNTYTSGTTVLGSGTLTHTGIPAGTLQIGDGGTTGSILGDVANDGTLAFNRSDAVSFGGVISGRGQVAQLGAGTLTLTGANTYSGGTLISAGTLVGSATSFGSGTILNKAALVIDQPGNAVLANAIDGTGSFTKRGAGSLNLTGISGLTGPTTVAAGRLAVNGSLAHSTVTVQDGAILGGNGTLGGAIIQAGGTIAPGNSIGTLTINGDLVLAPGSIYDVEIAGNGSADRIIVSGSATVTGSEVTFTALDPQTSYQRGQRYTLISATGGVNGAFAQVTTTSAFLDVGLDPKTGEVDLTINVKNDPGAPTGPGAAPAVFQIVAATPNQYATAVGLNSLPQVGGTLALYNSLLMLDAATARSAFDLLSGEIHASARTALVEESSTLRNTMNDRLRSAFGSVGAAPMATMNYGFTADLAPAVKGPLPRLATERFAVWGQGYGSWGRTDGDRNAQKLTRSTGGFLIGADVAVFDTMRVGLLAGYSRSEFDAKGRLSSGESDNYHIGLYGGGQWGALGLRAGASYTWHDVETSRTVAFAGFGNSLKSDYNAGTAQVFGELGYRFDVGQVALEPFAGLAYVNLHTDGFNETGGIAGLSGRSDDTSLGYSTLGLRASTSFALSGMDLTLRGGLAWRHAFGDVDPQATLAFAGANPFTVSGLPIARNAALIEAGLDVAISKSATLGVSYTGQLAQDAQDHAFKANLAVRF
ncbi:autotransporter-associated beta strand repeat-containing protein [Bosea sp. BK604]|uniref:autotransporter-associated beta strand repeat-containing protein n=1 Tax=Bosea sp. BK604 TaxID=2512180 RepID=UPI0020BD548D|nr:autotransporter-associated beta strand repeat-containing protein [Bosea sp. BK604]